MIDWDLAKKLWYEAGTTQKEKQMVKRSYNLDNNEPEQKAFEKPSEREHLFQVSDIYTSDNNPFKNGLPQDIVAVKCEVVGGDEEGRTLLQRLTLDQTAKGFFATRLFLKGLGFDYKGDITIDTDMWQGSQFYATVVHNGDYANIGEFNFDKKVENKVNSPGAVSSPEDIKWNE